MSENESLEPSELDVSKLFKGLNPAQIQKLALRINQTLPELRQEVELEDEQGNNQTSKEEFREKEHITMDNDNLGFDFDAEKLMDEVIERAKELTRKAALEKKQEAWVAEIQQLMSNHGSWARINELEKLLGWDNKVTGFADHGIRT
jgi:hypothetical protein